MASNFPKLRICKKRGLISAIFSALFRPDLTSLSYTGKPCTRCHKSSPLSELCEWFGSSFECKSLIDLLLN